MLFILQDALIAGALRISGGGAVSVACFAEGTPIADGPGPVAVEELAVGRSRWCRRSGATAPVVWTGTAAADAGAAGEPGGRRIRCGCGRGRSRPDVPDRDLYLLADHALFIDGWLVPAICLVNGESVAAGPGARGDLLACGAAAARRAAGGERAVQVVSRHA
jgi:hypothetical protein